MCNESIIYNYFCDILFPQIKLMESKGGVQVQVQVKFKVLQRLYKYKYKYR